MIPAPCSAAACKCIIMSRVAAERLLPLPLPSRSLAHSALPQEVPDSVDAAVVLPAPSSSPSPLVKQSNEPMCSCDPDEAGQGEPASPASSPEERANALDAQPVLSTHLFDQLSSHKVHSDQTSSSQKTRQTSPDPNLTPNPNYHLLQHLKKQLIFPSAVSCDQPLDLSLNSTRAQPASVASASSSSTTAKVLPEQTSILKVAAVGGGGESTAAVPAPVSKYVSLSCTCSCTCRPLLRASISVIASSA